MAVLTWVHGEISSFKLDAFCSNIASIGQGMSRHLCCWTFMSSNHQFYDSILTWHGTWPCLTCLVANNQVRTLTCRTLTRPSFLSRHPCFGMDGHMLSHNFSRKLQITFLGEKHLENNVYVYFQCVSFFFFLLKISNKCLGLTANLLLKNMGQIHRKYRYYEARLTY